MQPIDSTMAATSERERLGNLVTSRGKPYVFLPWVLSGILVSWVFAGPGRCARAPGGRHWPLLSGVGRPSQPNISGLWPSKYRPNGSHERVPESRARGCCRTLRL